MPSDLRDRTRELVEVLEEVLEMAETDTYDHKVALAARRLIDQARGSVHTWGRLQVKAVKQCEVCGAVQIVDAESMGADAEMLEGLIAQVEADNV